MNLDDLFYQWFDDPLDRVTRLVLADACDDHDGPFTTWETGPQTAAAFAALLRDERRWPMALNLTSTQEIEGVIYPYSFSLDRYAFTEEMVGGVSRDGGASRCGESVLPHRGRFSRRKARGHATRAKRPVNARGASKATTLAFEAPFAS